MFTTELYLKQFKLQITKYFEDHRVQSTRTLSKVRTRGIGFCGYSRNKKPIVCNQNPNYAKFYAHSHKFVVFHAWLVLSLVCVLSPD